ncbi:hypothetical protein SAMN05216268_103391 [Streptomyces yunnanensis]|uniref:Uncharacterized protein n=1 Tax=Streptomyces yunnanensis TaxID=156453 RepID=A0A9X8MPH2_9ACTN|nr:hypothetical protein SAMN05216268_103391 [Streptomyces yunnanensis]
MACTLVPEHQGRRSVQVSECPRAHLPEGFADQIDNAWFAADNRLVNGPLKPISARSLVAVEASELSELSKCDIHPIAIEVFEVRLRQFIKMGPQN